MTLALTRRDHGADDLRLAAGRTAEADQARRLLAIALLLEGASRTAAAQACGMQRQTLRDWVIRYNEAGIEGLIDRPRRGRPSRLSDAQLGELDRLVEAGPDVAVHGVVRWRCCDLRAIIQERFGASLCERSVGRLLQRRGFTRLSARPQHPKADAAAQAAFKQTSRRW